MLTEAAAKEDFEVDFIPSTCSSELGTGEAGQRVKGKSVDSFDDRVSEIDEG